MLINFDSDEDDTDGGPVRQLPAMPIPVRVLMLFLVTWQVFFTISDAGLAMLIVFFHHFFRLLSSLDTNCAILSSFAKFWPKSIATVLRVLNINSDKFVQYVVCPKCHSIYNYNQCVTSTQQSKTCWHVAYPRHRHKSRRKPCGTLLLRKERTRSGFVLRPRKVYTYKSLVASIERLLSRPGFTELCEQWRNRYSNQGSVDYIGDVYDGRIWDEFQHYNGQPFLAAPYNLALSLNVDWFNPFSNTQDSVGAVYVVIQNLPRDVRYKVDNVILCGIIPGLKEPQYTIASYLSPLVDELAQLWQGVRILIPSTGLTHNKKVQFCYLYV